ncbi:hypothetical protein BC827DRAFT_409516 [Russula dissimulans]|nr:hypothetical protein BC827DRAFT_409516 [Russula dissimulans]
MSLSSMILLFLMALLTQIQIQIVDRDSLAGNLSCGYERLNRRKHGGTSQVEWRSRNDRNTSLPPSPLLVSADNSRAEAMLGTSIPISSTFCTLLNWPNNSSHCGVIATSSRIGFASTLSHSTRDMSTESCLHVQVSRVICRANP